MEQNQKEKIQKQEEGTLLAKEATALLGADGKPLQKQISPEDKAKEAKQKTEGLLAQDRMEKAMLKDAYALLDTMMEYYFHKGIKREVLRTDFGKIILKIKKVNEETRQAISKERNEDSKQNVGGKTKPR